MSCSVETMSSQACIWIDPFPRREWVELFEAKNFRTKRSCFSWGYPLLYIWRTGRKVERLFKLWVRQSSRWGRIQLQNLGGGRRYLTSDPH